MKGEEVNSSFTSLNNNKQELIYKDAPYHTIYGGGNKSPKPTNGQDVLNNSIPVKNTSNQRVGVDKTTDEYVVFNNHKDNRYHGDVKEWKGRSDVALTEEMKQVLYKAGLTTRKGKILK